jgi:nucleotide-binding universal stress UspA family protein
MATILLATDGSPSAEAATEKAIELAKATGSDLAVITVWHVAVSAFAYEPLVVVPEVLDTERQRAVEVLAAARDRAAKAGVQVEEILVEGRPPDEICNVARERDASMIVIGSHGFGPARRLIFGSVSTDVLHHASCPVLVVRSKPAEDEATPESGGTADA